MPNVRVLFLAGALVAATCGGAAAQSDTSGSRIMVARYSAATTAAAGAARGRASGATTNASIRAGAMVSPRGAGLVGLDLSLPSVNTGSGWHGRLDVDAIFKANLGGVDTIVPVTVDLLSYSAGGAGAHNFYFGGGLGAVLGGPAKFDGKLILGTELTERIGAEINLHFTENDTLVTLLARIHI